MPKKRARHIAGERLIEGVGRALVLTPSPRYGAESDAETLASDWRAIGADMYTALKRFEGQTRQTTPIARKERSLAS